MKTHALHSLSRSKGALFTTALVTALLAFTWPVPVATSAGTTSMSISLTPLPPRLPTNSSGGSSFPALVVSMLDTSGNPYIPTNDTQVYLSSSRTAVLTVQPSIIIPAGAQYAIADLNTTATPGRSNVTAVAPGLGSATVLFNTYIARGYPSELSIYPLPATFSAGSPTSGTFAVEVEDAAGLPARTNQVTSVQVTSSNTTLLQTSGAQIAANKTIGYGTITTTGLPGALSVTASASGLVSVSTVIQIQNATTPAVSLSVSAPPNLPADGKPYTVLAVGLQDKSGRSVTAKTLVQVLLTSSRTDIATIQKTVNIPAGDSYVTVPIYTTEASGSTLVTASALNLTAASAQVTTVSVPPTNLGLYLSDTNALISKTSDTLNLVVQLQDDKGFPAVARSPAQVVLSFSDSDLFKVPVQLTIPKGADLVYAQVLLNKTVSGTFTAISNGLSSTSSHFSATQVLVTLNLGAGSTTVNLGQVTPVYFSIQSQGAPLVGATVQWSATGGTISPSSSKTSSTGAATAVFSSGSLGAAVVTASVSAPSFGTLNKTVTIIVINTPVAPKPTIISMIMSYLIYIVPAAAAAVILVVFLLRRRRKPSEESDEFGLGDSSGP